MYCEAPVLTTSVVQVSVLDGALDCWVFLSCLEVLHRIEGCCDPAQLAANSTHTVGLWVYAIEKVSSGFPAICHSLVWRKLGGSKSVLKCVGLWLLWSLSFDGRNKKKASFQGLRDLWHLHFYWQKTLQICQNHVNLYNQINKSRLFVVAKSPTCQASQISLLQFFLQCSGLNSQTSLQDCYRKISPWGRHGCSRHFRAVLSKSQGRYIDCLNDSLSVVLIHEIN